MNKFAVVFLVNFSLFGCASTGSVSELEARVSNLELWDKRTNKEIEVLVLNQVDIQHSVEETNSKFDRALTKRK